MAKLTVKQADNLLYTLAIPILTRMSRRLGYTAYVYWPGFDAPRKVDTTRVYVKVERIVLDREPLGMQADSGFMSKAEVRFMIYATELKSDYGICCSAAEDLSREFSRRRCGPDMTIKSGRWEDTEERYGRRIFTVIISYEYES